MIINFIVIGFTLVGLRNILFKKNGIEASLQWIILGFILGYRTIEPLPGLKLHPIEIFIYASIIRINITGAIKYRKMPVSVLVLGVFFIIYFIIDLLTIYNSVVLQEFKNAFLLVLVFFIANHILFSNAYLISLCNYYLMTTSIISVLGIIEYIFPLFMSSIFGYQMNYNSIPVNIFFQRLAFLYWGSHLAANLIAPVFPILLILKAEKNQTVRNNYLLTFFILINLIAIYLSGNRISWLIITIMFISIIIHYKSNRIPHLKTYLTIVTIIFVAYIYSQPVEGRYISTFKALTGQIDTRYDSSGSVRLARAKRAINSISNNPFGTGWSSQGWVHSDVLQISATIGAIPGFIFLFAPILLLLQSHRLYSSAPFRQNTRFFAICLLLIHVIISFCLNGNIFLVQCGVPLILLWSMAHGYIEKYNNMRYM